MNSGKNLITADRLYVRSLALRSSISPNHTVNLSEDGEARSFYEHLLDQAISLARSDDTIGALEFARQCLAADAPADISNQACNIARFSFWRAGDYCNPEFCHDPHQVICRNTIFERMCLEVAVEIEKANFSIADRKAFKATTYRSSSTELDESAVMPLTVVIARINYEKADYSIAADTLMPNLAAFTSAPFIDYVIMGYETLVRSLLAQRNVHAAVWLLHHAFVVGEHQGWPRLVAFTLCEQVRLHLRMGDVPKAQLCSIHLQTLAKVHVQKVPCARSKILEYSSLAQARLYAATGRTIKALEGFRLLRRQAWVRRDILSGTAYWMEEACLLWSADRPLEAGQVFRELLPIANGSSLLQTLIDQGDCITDLCSDFQKNNPRDPQNGIYKFTELLQANAGNSSRYDRDTSVVDCVQLSHRERGILQSISEGLSNKQVARILGISPETIKSHLKKIFFKLAVERRAQAVSKAQALGMISPSNTSIIKNPARFTGFD